MPRQNEDGTGALPGSATGAGSGTAEAPIPGPLPAAQYDDLLGPKCPACGWRRGQHRPASTYLALCPAITRTDPAATPAA